MKIGIITFHASHNCGSMLQAYALCKVLRDEYHQDAELIDFPTQGQDRCIPCGTTKCSTVAEDLI